MITITSFVLVLLIVSIESLNTCNTVTNTDYYGSDISNKPVSSAAECCTYCQSVTNCAAWSYAVGICYAKSASAISNPLAASGVTAGTVNSGCATIQNMDYFGSDISNKPVASPAECCTYCKSVSNCAAWSYYLGVCYAKSSAALSNSKAASGVVSGSLTSVPVTPPPPPPSTSSACPKRGLAYTFPSSSDMAAVKGKISWWYNWALKPTQDEANYQTYGIEYVPMVWGTGSLPSTGPASIPSTSKYLLGFNEPNYYAQSNIPVATAASLWPQVKQTADSVPARARIVSPAVNFCGGGCVETDPIVYLDKFFAACSGCQVDYIAVHWYGCTAEALTWFLNQLRKYNKKVWVTEFSCAQWDGSWQNSQQFQINYMKQAVDILEKDSMVFRYAWFSGRTAEIPLVNVFGATGQLTDLGTQYLNQPCGPAVFPIVEDTNNPTEASSNESNKPLIIGFSAGIPAALLVIGILLFLLKSQKKSKSEELA